jgi:hypothetical protein
MNPTRLLPCLIAASAVQAAPDVVRTEIRYFDHWLKGAANGVENDAPVKISVMGVHRCHDEQEWPPARATPSRLFLPVIAAAP